MVIFKQLGGFLFLFALLFTAPLSCSKISAFHCSCMFRPHWAVWKGDKVSISLNCRCGRSHSIREWGSPLQPWGLSVTSFTFELSLLEWLQCQLPQPCTHPHKKLSTVNWNVANLVIFSCAHVFMKAHTHTHTINSYMLPWHPSPPHWLCIGPIRQHLSHTVTCGISMEEIALIIGTVWE